jgi:hypothetical protein
VCLIVVPLLGGCGDPDKSPIQQNLGGILFGATNYKGVAYQACAMEAAKMGMTCEQLRAWLAEDDTLPASTQPPQARTFQGGEVPVSGYYRSNGTYVRPHTRTAPDGIKSNNRSFR